MNQALVFEALKSILKPYEIGMHVKTDDEKTYYLEYKSQGDAKPEMFAAVMIQKRYVSLYYMPIYRSPELLADISPTLRAHMQGKSCFNFTDSSDSAIQELAELIKRTATA